MRKNFRNLLLVLSFVFCLAALGYGQETTGSLEGVVVDPTGAFVPNITITIKNFNKTGATDTTGVSHGYSRTLTADGNGFFRILEVPPGAYTVAAESGSGFGPATYQNVKVDLGKITQLKIILFPQGGSTINFDADGSNIDVPLDSTASEISTRLSAQKLALLPKDDEFTSAIKAAPGARPDLIAGGWTVDGASSAENVFVIDGQEVTNYRIAGINGNNMVPFELVQELQVKSSGFDAEFSGATGGVLSVVTKGGSNQFHGRFGVGFRSSRFDGDPRPTMLRFGQTVEYYDQPKPSYRQTSPTALLSGPIIKDRVWFFGAWLPRIYEQTTETTFYTNAPAATRRVTGSDTYHTKVTANYGFARVDAEPFKKLRLSGTFLWNPVVTEGIIPFASSAFGSVDPTIDFGGTIGRLGGSALRAKQGGRDNANNATFRAVYSPLQNLVSSFRFTRGFLNEKTGNYFTVGPSTRYICQNGNSPAVNWGPDACTRGVNDPGGDYLEKDVSVRTSYEGDLSYLFNGGGRHELKGGFAHQSVFNDFKRNDATRIYLQYGVPIDNDANWFTIARPSGPICQLAGGVPVIVPGCLLGHGALYRYSDRGVGENLVQAVYIQDKLQPTSRLTLNLGVRFEKEDPPTFNEFPAGFNFGWTEKIAPRLGFAYDVSGDGNTKIFGSFGSYYDRMKFLMPQTMFGGGFYRVDMFEILPNSGPFRTAFTPDTILGNFSDVGGGNCPLTGFIGSGLSRCQGDYRIASNLPGLDISEAGGVDADLRPFQQREMTLGIEHELNDKFVVRGRYTRKYLVDAVEDAGLISRTGSEVFIVGNPGEGLHADFLRDNGYAGPFYKPERQYDAMELTLEKRLSNNYYFNVNYTLSRLYGNYSGLGNTDELNGLGGLNGLANSSPNINRSFDLPFIGGTAAGGSDRGRLAADRPHVFNAYGAYIFDWTSDRANSTEMSIFQTVQSGTPQTTFIQLIVPTIFTERGDLGRTPTFSQTDLGVTHRYRFGRDGRFVLVGTVNVLNLFDQRTVTGLQTQLTSGPIAITSAFPPAAFPSFYADGLDFPALINAYNSGVLLAPINTYLAGTATILNRTTATYGQPYLFQGIRQTTFGLNFQF